MSHALESLTARAYPRRAQSRRGASSRPVSQGANPFSDMLATEALNGVGKFLVRAVNDASDTEARTEMMYAAMLAGIAFNAAGCHLPHGLSYAVSGPARRTGTCPATRKASRSSRTAWRSCSTTRRCGGTRRRAAPSATCTARSCLGARHATARGPRTPGEVLAARVIELMRATAMPNGLDGARLRRVAPRRARHRRRAAVPGDPQRAEGRGARRSQALFRAALSYW